MRVCVCGTPVSPDSHSNRQYCNEECRAKERSKRIKKLSKGPFRRTCLTCDTIFWHNSSTIVSCSAECRRQYHLVEHEKRQRERDAEELLTILIEMEFSHEFIESCGFEYVGNGLDEKGV